MSFVKAKKMIGLRTFVNFVILACGSVWFGYPVICLQTSDKERREHLKSLFAKQEM